MKGVTHLTYLAHGAKHGKYKVPHVT